MATVNSTPKRYEPTAQDVYQGGVIFDEIADMALRAQYLLTEIIEAASNPERDSVTELAASARYLIERMGWAADLGSGKLDGSGMGNTRGGAEQWLMPPIYSYKQGEV